MSIFRIFSSARSLSSPTRIFPPASRVSGLSVFFLRVRQGVPSIRASSCTPPESVSTNLAAFNRERNSRYPTGSLISRFTQDLNLSRRPSSFAFAMNLGCAGKIVLIGILSIMDKSFSSFSRESVFSGLCTVKRQDSFSLQTFTSFMLSLQTSEIVFPVTCIFLLGIPSSKRLIAEVSVGARRISEQESISILFISSGILRSKERSPASI